MLGFFEYYYKKILSSLYSGPYTQQEYVILEHVKYNVITCKKLLENEYGCTSHPEDSNKYIYNLVPSQINKIFHFVPGKVKINLKNFPKIKNEDDLTVSVIAESTFVSLDDSTSLWFVFSNNYPIRGSDFIFRDNISGSNKPIKGSFFKIKDISYKTHHCGSNYRYHEAECNSVKLDNRGVNDYHIYIPKEGVLNNIYNFKNGYVKIDLSHLQIQETDLKQYTTPNGVFITAGNVKLKFRYDIKLQGSDFYFNNNEFGTNQPISLIVGESTREDKEEL